MIVCTTLEINGMTCTMCSLRIEASLEELDGISRVDVSYAVENAVLKYDSAKVQLPEIKMRIEQLGFTVD